MPVTTEGRFFPLAARVLSFRGFRNFINYFTPVRTPHKLGVPCVAVHNTIDKDALHANYVLGDNPMKLSFLLGYGDKYQPIHTLWSHNTRCAMLIAIDLVFVLYFNPRNAYEGYQEYWSYNQLDR
ncbi:hypothetical protein V2J09_013259 [Rumex salicifolius]